MTESLYKFPSTPHLADLGGTGLRADKVLSAPGAESFLSGPIVVEEKIDGANLGLSLGAGGNLRFQNRGTWLDGPLRGQWSPLRDWAAARLAQFQEHLPESCILFGEWCFAQHSIAYDRLPDWFIGFDVFDPSSGIYWDHLRRDALLAELDLPTVPILSKGIHKLEDLQKFLNGTSRWGHLPTEGLYLRREADGRLKERAKLVRPGFTQQITEHWSRKPIRRNRIAHAPEPTRPTP